MGTRPFNKLFQWNSLRENRAEAVVVLPSPHGEYKSGISYSDALATGEIYGELRKFGYLDVRTPDLVGDHIGGNLILIGGPKANSITQKYRARSHASLNFDLDDGVPEPGGHSILMWF